MFYYPVLVTFYYMPAFMFVSQFAPDSFSKIHKKFPKFGDELNSITPEQSDFSSWMIYVIHVP